MDGVDLACCDFFMDPSGWSFQIVAAETIPYPGTLKQKLALTYRWAGPEIDALDRELAIHYAALLNAFHKAHKLKPDLIASHGHTLLHEPDRGITFQAGNGRIISERTGITVVNDFRSPDVAQGGQGAPLVPVGDQLLFHSYDACLNLGGFANISYDDPTGRRIAYDPCPANLALNWIAHLVDLEFDDCGKMAEAGSVNHPLLENLDRLPYYQRKPPKSLGREWFLEVFLPVIEKQRVSVNDLMATIVEHIALQIARSINHTGIKSLLVTGGGALNLFLIQRLKEHIHSQIIIPEKMLIQFKEALVFAFLGVLRLRGEINCLSSVTGGKKDLSTGTVYTV